MTEISKNKALIGGVVTLVIGVATAIIGYLYLFAEYQGLLKGFSQANKPASVVLQSIVQPIFTQVLLVAGVLLAISALGYFTKRKWAFIVGFVGSILVIFSGWMLSMFPMMVGLPPKYMVVFVMGAIAFFVLLYVKGVNWMISIVSFLFGIAMTMNFMNGMASLNKIIGAGLALNAKFPDVPHVAMAKMMSGNPGLLYESIQKALWLTALGFAILCIAVIYRKDWVYPLGLSSSIVAIITGTPVAYIDTMVDKAGEELSMFSFAPIASVLILILLLVFKEKLWSGEKLLGKKSKADKATQDVSA